VNKVKGKGKDVAKKEVNGATSTAEEEQRTKKGLLPSVFYRGLL
jgi:hypothetical protein